MTSLPRRVPALLLGIVAFALVLIATEPPGPGLDPDALQYMGAAESLVAHGTYRVPTAPWSSADSTMPLAHFPPGLSTALALPVAFGMTPPQGARLLNALAAGVTVTVLVLLVAGAATPLAGIFLAVALFAMSPMLEVHVSVLSEPLFLALLVATLAAMTVAPDRPLRAGILAALAAAMRYAGVALVGAVVLWQLLQRGPLAARLRRAALAAAPAIVLQGTWVLRTRHAAGTTAAIRRTAVYARGFGATLSGGLITLRDWLVPDPDAWTDPFAHRGAIAVAAGVALLALMLMGTIRLWRERRGSDDGAAPVNARRLLAASVLIVLCYLGMVLVSRLLADPNIPLDARILAPVLLLLSTMAAVTIGHWWIRSRTSLARIAVCGALLGWFLASATVVRQNAAYVLTYGSDFAGDQWRRSPLLEWARRAGATYPLYSNWPAAVYFHLHRPARLVPRSDDVRGFAAFADTLRVRDGRVLAFRVSDRQYIIEPALVRMPGLRVVLATPDGVVLAPAPRSPTVRR